MPCHQLVTSIVLLVSLLSPSFSKVVNCETETPSPQYRSGIGIVNFACQALTCLGFLGYPGGITLSANPAQHATAEVQIPVVQQSHEQQSSTVS